MPIFGKLLNKFKKDGIPLDDKVDKKTLKNRVSMSVEITPSHEPKDSEAQSDGADTDPGDLGKKTAKIAKRKTANHVEYEGIALAHPKSDSMKENEVKPAKQAAPGFQNAAEAAELRKVLGLKRTKTAKTEIQFEGTGRFAEESPSGRPRSQSNLVPPSPSKSRSKSLGPTFETTPPASGSNKSTTPSAMPKAYLKPPGSVNAKAKEKAAKRSTDTTSGNSTVPAYMQNRTLKPAGSSVGKTDVGKPEEKVKEMDVPEFMKNNALKPAEFSVGKPESGKPKEKEKDVPEFMKNKTLKPAGSTIGNKPVSSEASQEDNKDKNNLPAFKDRVKMFQNPATV